MADERHLAEARQEARRIIHDVARTIDRKLEVEVRDVPGQERMQVSLTQAQSNEAQALANYRISIAQLERAVGRR